jgi:hypothetical protein
MKSIEHMVGKLLGTWGIYGKIILKGILEK